MANQARIDGGVVAALGTDLVRPCAVAVPESGLQVAVAGFNDVKDEHGPFYDDCVLLDSEGCRNFDIIFDPDPTHHRLFAALHVLCGALSALYLATIPSGHRNC